MSSKTENIVPNNQQNITTHNSKRSRVGVAWVAFVAFVAILLLLLIFIMQNSASMEIHYLGKSGMIGFGVAMLLAAVIGSILTILIGSARILQLKFTKKRNEDN